MPPMKALLTALMLAGAFSAPRTAAAAPNTQVAQAKPWLGVAIEKGESGVLIKDVLAGTPAENAGLKAGDQIVAVGGKPVHLPEELIKAVQTQGVGRDVEVKWLHGKTTVVQTVKLVARPDELAVLKKQLEGKPA